MTSSDDRAYPIREAFRLFFPGFLERHPDLPSNVQRVAECIMRCKTGELGYNIDICEQCGAPRIHACSCNNRSCPCCQAALERKWEASRNTELIKGIAYFHVVFTVPHELNPLFQANMKLLLDLLFKCVQDTLLSLCEDKRYMGAMPGIISVLHTWGQRLNFHPHVHTCVSGGGITPDGRFRETCHKGFFIPEKVIAASFRGRFLCGLKKLHEDGSLKIPDSMDGLNAPEGWRDYINGLFNKRWLPFVKETFNGKGNAIKYLARYSFRTAIANSRIVSVNEKTVTFRYKDYADHNAEKTMTLPGEQFIGLFLRHVLPKGFNRTRFSGYLTNCRKTRNLRLINKLRHRTYNGNPYASMKTADLMFALYKIDISRCSICHGKMIHHARAQPKSALPSLQAQHNPAMC